jgi:hypothetical protein
MPYVQYDDSNNIVGVFANQQAFAQTFVADNDAGVVAFLASRLLQPTLNFLQFIALFTTAEQDAIFASNDTQTKMFIAMAAGASASPGLQLTNAEVISGINYLATATTASPPGPGLITAARAAAILAGQAPS